MKDNPTGSPEAPRARDGRSAERIVIFRRGSIGDAVVSIPALNEVARRYPGAERWVLTNLPVMEKAAAVEQVLKNSMLVQGCISLPRGGGGIAEVLSVRRQIRALGAETLIYLSEPSRPLARLRERMFFRSCRIRRIVGRQGARDTATYRRLGERLWESEAQRLLRAVDAPPEAEPDWSFDFLAAERAEAAAHLAGWAGRHRYILFSLGAKLPDKDWGDTNWIEVLGAITASAPDLGLVAIGSADESARTQRVIAAWRGPTLELCGETPPRISALLGENALFYLGHDSGPMHLAALVGTPCIAVFSARAKPGVWFPRGDHNRIFYPWDRMDSVPDRAGFRVAGTSIAATPPQDVAAACLDFLSAT